MEDDCGGGGDAEGDADEVASRDDHAVNEVVDGVSKEVHPYVRLGELVCVSLVLPEEVAVLPVEEFFDDKKGDDAYERVHAESEWLFSFFEDFGHEVEEGVSDECSYGKADKEEECFVEECFV